MSALRDAVAGDEVAEDVYAEVLPELDGLEGIRSIVAMNARQQDHPDLTDSALTVADGIE